MKKRIILIILAVLPLLAMAQPSWVKKATKSVFTLKTFAEDGSLIGSSNGFFTSANGDAVSNYTPFKGAAKAVVIDATGKELPVVSIVGVNDMYDVVKFRVNGKTQPLIISSAQTPVGSQVWLLPYHEIKNVPEGTIRKAEAFQNEYEYYTVALAMPVNTVSTPLINQAGEVIGLMQQPASDKDTLSYAVSARFADSLKISGFGTLVQPAEFTMIGLPAERESKSLLGELVFKTGRLRKVVILASQRFTTSATVSIG